MSRSLFTSSLLFAALLGRVLSSHAHAETPIREIPVTVQGGYHPDRIEVPAGERVRLVFTRTEYSGCTRELLFPALELRVELPTNQAVVVELPPLAPGEWSFHCGMKMIHGSVVVVPAPGAP